MIVEKILMVVCCRIHFTAAPVKGIAVKIQLNLKGAHMNYRKRLIHIAVAAFFAVGAVQACWASNFSVDPVRVVLDVQHLTERLAVKNESDRPLTLLIKPYRWTQSDKGTDIYNETEDLIVFPRALTLAAGEEGFVRVGLSSPSVTKEQAFRMYVEEQPVKDEQSPKGASARILMRLGIPVFAQPLKPEPTLKVTELSVAKAGLHITLANGGNSFVTADQVTITGVDKKGTEVFARNLGGFYLLAERARAFDVSVPRNQCSRITKITVTTRTDGKEQRNVLNMSRGACEGK